MPPHRRKETLRLILKRADVSPEKLSLELYGRPPELQVLDEILTPKGDGGGFAEIPSWLPGQDSNLDAQLQRLMCCHYTTGQPSAVANVSHGSRGGINSKGGVE